MAYTITVKIKDEVYSYQMNREHEALAEARWETKWEDTLHVTVRDDVNGVVIFDRAGEFRS